MADDPQCYAKSLCAWRDSDPERLDGRGLGDAFEVMVTGPSVSNLTTGGFLVLASVYAPPEGLDLSRIHSRGGDYAADELTEAMSDKALVGNAIEHYGRLCRGVPAVAFCCGIGHSRAVAERFSAAGYRAAHVDGDTEKDERRKLIAALGTGTLDVLTNAGLISEGMDVPAIGAAILLRPTQSLGLYLQQVGRALRPVPGEARGDHPRPRREQLGARTARRGALLVARRQATAPA